MKRFTSFIILGAFLLSSCTTDPYTGEQKLSKTAIGAGLGAAIGGLGGYIIGGGSNKKKRKRALITAGVGALAGGGIGLYMDNQEAKLRQRLRNSGVSVTRRGDQIILNMPSNITFDSGSSSLKPQFHEVLNSVVIVFKEYNKTLIDVNGHTDSDGSDSYNMDLSMRRADSVARYMVNRQINPKRIAVQGYGERNPIASNSTYEGKSRNRRVEIHISPLTQS